MRMSYWSSDVCSSDLFANEYCFIPGRSHTHGRIDVSHAFGNNRGENHRDDPLTIPSLRGVKTKDRLGHDGRGTSLREFTRRVIITEFGGNEPDPTLLDALVAYQETLQPATPVDRPVPLAGEIGSASCRERVCQYV